jgi:hypothetical protein
VAAGLRTLTTGFGTFLAVVGVVFSAFFSTGIACFSTELTNAFSELRTASHLANGERAEVGAGSVQLDTTSHHLDVLLMEAGCRAVFACEQALMAGIDAVLVVFVSHFISPFVVRS